MTQEQLTAINRDFGMAKQQKKTIKLMRSEQKASSEAIQHDEGIYAFLRALRDRP